MCFTEVSRLLQSCVMKLSSHKQSSAARLMSLCECLPRMTARLNGDLICLECGRGQEGGGIGWGKGMKASQGENNLLYQNSFGFVMGKI